mmetsp:Transcript_13810/g.33144  ORF Transcript_13810/g.33144 Transcript_13810/m.33144 type:complete len:144 (+) Transcript_13810:205-636(+)
MLFEQLSFCLVLALFAYDNRELLMEKEEDFYTATDNSALWLLILVIIVVVKLGVSFWVLFTMIVLFWSYGMNTFVLTPLLQQYQPIFEEEYGFQVTFETRQQCLIPFLFFTVRKVICFQRFGGGNSHTKEQERPRDFAPPTIV